MTEPLKVAIRASTQEHLDIEDIQDNIIILKDGGASLVIATTAINFDLLSEQEQEATIFAYASLLNSLNFSIQIVIRSQRKDISSYLRLLKAAEAKQKKEEMKEQIKLYSRFIQETVQKNQVLDKKFYLVVSMTALELGISKTLSSKLKGSKKLPFDKDYILKKAKINLIPKRDHLIRLFARLGLKGYQLNTRELIQLFFNIYNPESVGQQIVEPDQYQIPMTEISLRQTLTEDSTPQVKKKDPKIQVAQKGEASSKPTAPDKDSSLNQAPPQAPRLNPKEQLEEKKRQEVIGIEAPKDEANLNNSSETIYNQIDQIVNQKTQGGQK